MKEILSELFHLYPARDVRVLDVGCGQGAAVGALRDAGYDAYGTDLPSSLPANPPPWLVPIRVTTTTNLAVSYKVVGRYELPFDDKSFAAVVSYSTVEHVQDKGAFFSEIHRVLRTGGVTVHSFPGRYYLPREPHLFVPLVPALWNRVPRWWFALWALVGVRNQFQRGEGWRAVTQRNVEYHRDSLSYSSIAELDRLLAAAGFSNVRNQFEFYVAHGTGGYARLMRGRGMSVLATVFPFLQQTRDVLLTAEKRPSER